MFESRKDRERDEQLRLLLKLLVELLILLRQILKELQPPATYPRPMTLSVAVS
jgi:hypothetical protein